MMYFDFMKNFLLADSGEQITVGLISISWAQKRLIPTFQTWCISSSWEFFFSPIPATTCQSDSFRPGEPKNVKFLLSWHDVLWVHEKFFSHRFKRADGCCTHFGLLSPKTFHSCFLDILYVEFMKNFLLAHSGEQMPVKLISTSWAQKRFIPTF